jgi:hypothetical protein
VVLRSVYYEHLPLPAFLVNAAAGATMWASVRCFVGKFRSFQKACDAVARTSSSPLGVGTAAITQAMQAQQSSRGRMSRVAAAVQLASRPACFLAGIFLGAALQRRHMVCQQLR